MGSNILNIAYAGCFVFAGVIIGILIVWNRTDRTVDLVSRNVFRGQSERAWKQCDKLEAQLESYNKYDAEGRTTEGPRYWTDKIDALEIEIEVLEKRIERLRFGQSGQKE